MGILKSIRTAASWQDWWNNRLRRMRARGGIGGWAQHFYKAQTRPRMRANYIADGFAVKAKNISFLENPKFAAAWREAVKLNQEGWKGNVPNIEWRAHVACWAAQQAMTIEGDFVECGVHTGLLSVTVCNFLDFAKLTDRKFWLFDTWAGVPVEGIEGEEQKKAKLTNLGLYDRDVFPLAQRNFAPFPNVKLVRGALPGTLAEANIEKIAYMSVDMNNMRAEKAVIEALWPKLSKGAMIVLDDYGFAGFEDQHDMWDEFARSVGRMVVTLPTGQGILIK